MSAPQQQKISGSVPAKREPSRANGGKHPALRRAGNDTLPARAPILARTSVKDTVMVLKIAREYSQQSGVPAV